MVHYILRLFFKAGLLIFLFIPELLSGQNLAGQVLCSETNLPVAYVNVVIIGRSIGTVSDMQGHFSINLEKCHDNDSLHFSMIGYGSKSLSVRNFKEDSLKKIHLAPVVYDLQEVVCSSSKRKFKQMRIGKEVVSDALRSGFADNSLGSELGIKVYINERVRLKDLNLNVAICTYDSVTYRLNIYQSDGQSEYRNILTQPIYISFSKDDTREFVSFDLCPYSIVVEGDVVIALQLYKDMGEGRLLFQTNFMTGSTQFRKTNDDKWAEATGEIGMFLHGDILR